MSSSVNEQDFFNSYPSVDEDPCAWFSDCALDWSTDLSESQLTPNIPCTSWIPHENAQGLSDMYESESVWSTERFARPSATITSNPTDAPFFSTPSSYQPPTSGGVVHFWQPAASHQQSVREHPTFSRVGETRVPRSVHAIPLQQSHLVRKPTVRSQSDRVGASRMLLAPSVAPRSRYTPYPLISDNARWDEGNPSTSVYHCQWFDGASPCGAVVAGTKNAIGQHLQAVHAIRLKADKSAQVCHWGKCRKSMRKESIPRHILAVHMQDKVGCPSCGSRFARPDSLQRHQRTCGPKGEDVSDSCMVPGGPPLL